MGCIHADGGSPNITCSHCTLEEQAARFIALFRSEGRYCLYDPNKRRFMSPGDPLTLQKVVDHLKGFHGLAVDPSDAKLGHARFGALDIDYPAFKSISLSIANNGMELIAVRSKSGFTHVYSFYKRPESVAKVADSLAHAAIRLGVVHDSIYPDPMKNRRVILLPYFGTGTPAYRNGEELSLSEFLDWAEKLQQ